MHKSAAAAAAGAALVLSALAVPASAAEDAAAVLTVPAGQDVLPGGQLTVTGSIGEGCDEGKIQVFQEYWPKPSSSGSTIVQYYEEGAPVTGDEYLHREIGGAFTATVGVPDDATRSNLYGVRPGQVPHYVWVEATGCEDGAWKRASDRFAATVPVQPLSRLTELTATPRTVVAGESVVVTATRCQGGVAKAEALVGRTAVLGAPTVADGLVTVTFAIPTTAPTSTVTATVLCTQSQTPDNQNSVQFSVRALPAVPDPATGGTGTDGTGAGGSDTVGTGTTGADGTSGTTGSVTTVSGTSGATATAAGGTRSAAATVAPVATPVSGSPTFAG